MITYCGVALLDQTEELQRMLDGLWHPEGVDYFRHSQSNGNISHLPLPTESYRPHSPIRLGVLSWPTGASRFATFHALVSDTQLRAIQQAILAAAGFFGSMTLVMSDGSTGANVLRNGRIQATMLPLPPRPITQAARTFAEGRPSKATHDLWLLTLVDVRYAWRHNGVGGGSHDSTWSNAFDTWINSCVRYPSASATIDTIPAAYGKVRGYRWMGSSGQTFKASEIIDTAADNVGARLTHSLSGAIRLWRPSNAKTAQQSTYLDHYKELIAGGLMWLEDMQMSLPTSSTVYFDGDDARSQQNKTIASLAITDAGTAGTEAGRGLPFPAWIYSDLPNTPWPGQPTDSNAAIQVATDWYNWRLASRVDAVFRGLRNWTITGADWLVEWSCYNCGPFQCTTRVLPLPWHDWQRWSALPIGSIREIADATAPNSTEYYSRTASKMVYKTAGAVVNPYY